MIEIKQNTRYEVLTPLGYRDFSGMRKTTKAVVLDILLSNRQSIKASKDHKFVKGSIEILAKDLKVGDYLNDTLSILDIREIKNTGYLYDLVNVGGGNLYLADNIVNHNCNFLASGDTVFEPDDMLFYEQTYLKDPLERRGVDGNLWIWEGVDYMKSYMVVADVARGDSADYSGFHVFDIENCVQVAEYKGKLSPKDFGNVLVGIASEYNDALLVIENANIGWATIEQALEREYKNIYYSSTSNMETVESYMSKYERDKLVPGFTMSVRTRPLVIAKMIEYIREKSVTIQSKRLIGEMRVFVWKNGKPQAQTNYNDDLLMACATALYVRDTALRLRQQGLDLARAQLSSFSNLNAKNAAIVRSVGSQQNNPYIIDNGRTTEDISWLLK